MCYTLTGGKIMNIHEYQGKAILREYGVNVPDGYVAYSVEEAVKQAEQLTSDKSVVKAEIHAGAGGKAGGGNVGDNLDEVRVYANDILGKVLVTPQTGPQGKEVQRLLIEEGCSIQDEHYLSFLVDSTSSKVILMASAECGTDIEEVAEHSPEKIFQEVIDPLIGLAPFQARKIAFQLNIPKQLVNKAVKLMMQMYEAFIDKDCSILEINPLV